MMNPKKPVVHLIKKEMDLLWLRVLPFKVAVEAEQVLDGFPDELPLGLPVNYAVAMYFVLLGLGNLNVVVD